MGATREAIELLHRDVELDFARLLNEEPNLTAEEALQKFESITNTAVWEGLYTLANHIDALRAT